ncbi:glycosyltransferase [Hymenobacter perfusus]|uniref:Glycosyltransferase n=1 Tax=Hymenobacter perfusus TaxID=1236770 RepID=A0A428KA30_9BACT|nr:glycosyltransferase [Hymenobacter perfusus]
MSVAGWLWSVGLVGTAGTYLGRMLQYRRAWKRLVTASSVPDLSENLPAVTPAESTPAFSILIAARNEAENLPYLLRDLAAQLPVPGGFEVIIVDDHSTDATAQVVQAAAQQLPFPVQLLPLAGQPGTPTGKKAAVQAAITVARAPWLLLTDADCRVPAGWVRAYARLVATDATARFISGPVLLTGAGWLATLQGLELAGLVGVGAASIGRNQPTMCNGANLAYRRQDFYAVQGFQGNEAVASGDDEFLLHKLHAAFSGSIRFLADPQAVVQTGAQPTLRLLLRQRVRWASKWRHYQTRTPQRLAVLVLLANLTFPVGAGLWAAGLVPGGVAGLSWALKLLADALLLGPVLGFLGRRRWLWWVPILQLAYAPYALLTGLAGLRGSYQWKGRQLR